jgi:hypothetical protein
LRQQLLTPGIGIEALVLRQQDIFEGVEQRSGGFDFVNLAGSHQSALPSAAAQSLGLSPPLVRPMAWAFCPPAGLVPH